MNCTLSDILCNYDSLIIDVDGTLYKQKPVRIAIALDLLKHYLTHPLCIKELAALYHYRKFRDRSENAASTQDDQYGYAAAKSHLSVERTAEVIKYWMFEQPLTYIAKNKNKELISAISSFAPQKNIIIYSDYPAEDKLDALGVTYSHCFFPSSEHDYGLKPSKKMITYIIEQTGIVPEKTLFIGDRDEKDGLSARNGNMDFYNIRKNSFVKNIEA